MNDANADRPNLNALADEALRLFEDVASTAQRHLADRHEVGLGSLASVNSMTSESAQATAQAINDANRADAIRLSHEPAIARVAVEDHDGHRQVYYICRAAPIAGFKRLASYRSPVGRLASLDIGDAFTLPGGHPITVVGHAVFTPDHGGGAWDSRNTIYKDELAGPLTIASLRALLAQETPEGDSLEAMLAAEEAAQNVIEGLRRETLTSMTLRDQPVLDKYQDEIFRLPIADRLLILGPPGTGKTTTLIRRLGQKRDLSLFDPSERLGLEDAAVSQQRAHADSWIMFTPTELLEHYLREAFAREGVPATGERIKTWDQMRRSLARDALPILRNGNSSGMTLRPSGHWLSDTAEQDPIGWFEDFNRWQHTAFVDEMVESAETLKSSGNDRAAAIGELLAMGIQDIKDRGVVPMLRFIATQYGDIDAVTRDLKSKVDELLRATLARQHNRDKDFLPALANELDRLSADAAATEDLDDPDLDDEDVQPAPTTPIKKAVAAYETAIRAQARAAITKRAPTKGSRTDRLLQWIGDRGLLEGDRPALGRMLLTLAGVRRFMRPAKQYLDRLPIRYRAFRRQMQGAGTWYQGGRVEPTDAVAAELDLMLAAMLRTAADLLSVPAIRNAIDTPSWTALQRYLPIYRTQVLVDEATDFSPLQLGCIAAMADPRFRSFFACGDFNQRLTTWGARRIEDFQWAVRDIATREINIGYRQSRKLKEFSDALILANGGSPPSGTMPAGLNRTGEPPALLEHADLEQALGWLGDRILEIERAVGKLPTIAVLVPDEENIETVARALAERLANANIPVEACKDGRVIGNTSAVRVFDVRYIKGLEFEGVFFLETDRLAESASGLLDKYLYVGATRAATFLGLTCRGAVPAPLESLRAHFGDRWK
jgi:transcription elongation GreA/GreB family factor/DNA polymerase III delta prime subunit